MTKKLLYISLFLFSLINLYSAKYKIVNSEGNNFSITAENMNGNDFIALDDLYSILFPGSSYNPERGEIRTDNKTLKCTPASFFIVYDRNDDLRIAQMTLPAIEIRNELYVPVESFFNTIETLNIYDIDIEKNVINIKYFTHITKLEPPKQPVKNIDEHTEEVHEPVHTDSSPKNIEHIGNTGKATIKYAFNKSSGSFLGGLNKIEDINNIHVERRPETFEHVEKTPDNVENIEFPPNLYVLPPNLIRSELEEK